jgi:hypothetical protein
MKKIFKTSLIALAAAAAITLTACASKDTAKKAFIADYVSMSQTQDNVQEVSLNLSKFKATGQGTEEANKLEGTKATIKVSTDEKNKAASMAGSVSILGKDYKLDFVMSPKGMYIDNNDIKTLYQDNKSLIEKSSPTTISVYDAMVGALNKPYLLLDAKTIDSGVKSSDENWETVIDNMFKASGNKVSEKDLTAALKDVPDSNFSKNGSKTSFDVPMKSSFFKDFLSKMVADKAGITKAQIDQMMKSFSSADLKNISVKITIDSKTHEAIIDFGGKVANESKDTVDFKMNITSKSSSSKASITVPSDDQAQTIQDVTSALFSSMSSGDTQ